jgi:hypothetical protein
MRRLLAVTAAVALFLYGGTLLTQGRATGGWAGEGGRPAADLSPEQKRATTGRRDVAAVVPGPPASPRLEPVGAVEQLPGT